MRLTHILRALCPRFLASAALLLVSGLATAALPEIQTWQKDGEPRVLFVAADEIPIVDVRLVFRAGSSRDGEHAGLAMLVSSLLDEGAGELDATAYSEALAMTGAAMDKTSLRDMAWVGMRSLSDKKYFDPAMDLLALTVGKPRFDADAVAQQKTAALVSARRRTQAPSSLADEAFYANIYGDHPYARPPGGTEASLESITADDIRAFFNRYYVVENATAVIIGDLTRPEAEALVTRLAQVMGHGEQAPDLPAVVKPEARTVLVENDSLQSHVRVGLPGIRRGDADYFPLIVGNHVLGGGSLVSRLFEEVREKRGLSYSVYSGFTPMAARGPFSASLQTGVENTDEAIAVLRDTVANFVQHGPTQEELDAAKQNLIGGFPLRLASNGSVLEYLAMIGAYDLPLDYLERFRENVAAVTVDSVREAFARHVKPDEFVTVVVGARGAPATEAAPPGDAG